MGPTPAHCASRPRWMQTRRWAIGRRGTRNMRRRRPMPHRPPPRRPAGRPARPGSCSARCRCPHRCRHPVSPSRPRRAVDAVSPRALFRPAACAACCCRARCWPRRGSGPAPVRQTTQWARPRRRRRWLCITLPLPREPTPPPTAPPTAADGAPRCCVSRWSCSCTACPWRSSMPCLASLCSSTSAASGSVSWPPPSSPRPSSGSARSQSTT
mmetsp:Transcript_16498/g.53795  ORF Transcript_16498/g.53795 Transcript_16498/m.53795 type:complete len:212 (+) Transcript_16498:736-1371(+)